MAPKGKNVIMSKGNLSNNTVSNSDISNANILKNSVSKYKALKGKKVSCLLFIMLFFTGISITNLSHAKTLKVCYDQWAPMTIFPSEASNERGGVIDMLTKIYTSKNYKLEYYEVLLAKGLDMVAEGLCDMLPKYLFSKQAEKDFVYANEATFSYLTAFVVRRNEPWRYNGIKSIKGKRITTGPSWDYSSMSVYYQNYINEPKNSNLIEVIAGNNDIVK